jgi:hypothetical protein
MISVEKRFTGQNCYTVYIGDIVVGRDLCSSSADALVAELRSHVAEPPDTTGRPV